MSVRIVAGADFHEEDGRHLLTETDHERALDDVQDICVERGAQLLAIAGDLFHLNRPTPATLARVGHFVERLHIPVVISRGNHDPDSSEIVRYFRGNVIVPHEPEVFRFDALGVDCAVLPWLPDARVRAAAAGAQTKEETAALLTGLGRKVLAGLRAKRRPGIPLVLVTHALVGGSETASGFSFGYRAAEFGYVLELEELADFELVIAGHVHQRQSPQHNVVIPGSLLPLDFSETGPHGVVVADVSAGSADWEFVDVPGPTIATWEWDDAKLRQQCSMPAVFNGPAIDLLRVRVTCSESTAREFPASVVSAQLYRAGARMVRVEYDISREDRRRDAGMSADLDVSRAISRHLADHYPDEAQATRLERAAQAAIGLVTSSPEWAGGDLRVRAIECTDFLGVAEARLELGPEDRIVALTGPVGRGKSTLGCDAVRHTLFGSSRAGARPTEGVVRQGQADAQTALEIEDTGTGQVYRIVRRVHVDGRGRASSSLDVMEAV